MAWPDWAYASDGTFGNRWDDPDGVFRVLYASSQRVGAFVETLARFRPDLGVVAALAEIEGEESDDPPHGVVPARWLAQRAISEACPAGRFADVGDAQSLATIRSLLAAEAIRHGLAEIDAAAIRLAVPRAFTQSISRLVYSLTDEAGVFAGIRYQSRLGDQFVNWAVFERPGHAAAIHARPAEAISADDPDLQQALALLGLRLA